MTDAGLKPRTVAEEMTAGRRNTPDFAWPAVALFLGLFAILGLSLWAAISGRISYAFGALINTGCIYVLYTIVHEAIHGNISLRRKDLRWLDLWIGTAACILLWLFCFPHLKQHMVHHARANTDEDPDIYARGSFPGWLFLRLPLALLKYFSPLQLYRDCKRYQVPARQVTLTYITHALQSAVLAGLILAGFWREILVLWFMA